MPAGEGERPPGRKSSDSTMRKVSEAIFGTPSTSPSTRSQLGSSKSNSASIWLRTELTLASLVSVRSRPR
jgi:hypothetical protein